MASRHVTHTEKEIIMSQANKIALITGANRGIGRAIAKRYAAGGFHVIVAARDAAQAEIVVGDIRKSGGSAETIALDVSQPESIASAAKILASRHTKIDVLVNNAAINRGVQDSILVASAADIHDSMQTNAFGPLELTKALLPQIKAAGGARIVNVSSAAGSVAETTDANSPYGFFDAASYRLSKAMLNMITGMLAKTLRQDDIKVNAMCPGWTKTDMGGDAAPNTPEQGAELAFRLGTLGKDGATGGFFNEAGALAW
jgi:NAD(P)-dependent dehydrogenase (short-subunit alcohol dehydrogenase family)